MIAEAGQKMRVRGRHQRVTSNHSRKTRCPNETVVSCGGPESKDGRRVCEIFAMYGSMRLDYTDETEHQYWFNIRYYSGGLFVVSRLSRVVS